MALIPYIYSISQDFPGGKVNLGKLQDAIRNSLEIVTSLNHIETSDDILTLWFRANLSLAEQIVVDGGSGSPYNTHPAGGLIAFTDTSETVNSPNLVSQIKPLNCNRRYGFSPNFTDPTTWWEQAIKVTNEASGTGDGITTQFQLGHGHGSIPGEAILDLEHGKVTEEDFMSPSGGLVGDYNIVVKVAGIIQTQREAFEISGGDFSFDYSLGKITFFIAPAAGAPIVITYWYIPSGVGPTFTMLPSPGTQLIIDDAECSFSSDVEMLDTLYSGAWLCNYNMWAPVAKNPTPYKTIADFYNYTYGAFPTVAALGTNARGFNASCMTLRWDFKSYFCLEDGTQGRPAFKMSTKHNRKPFSGLSATITIYALEVPLSRKLIG